MKKKRFDGLALFINGSLRKMLYYEEQSEYIGLLYTFSKNNPRFTIGNVIKFFQTWLDFMRWNLGFVMLDLKLCL